MKKIIILFSVMILSASRLAQSQDDFESKLLKQFHSIQSEEMMSWLEKLCSPEFNGRLTGTPEFISSAEWVAGKLKEWGIKPAGDNANYFQWFDFPYTGVNEIEPLKIIGIITGRFN